MTMWRYNIKTAGRSEQGHARPSSRNTPSKQRGINVPLSVRVKMAKLPATNSLPLHVYVMQYVPTRRLMRLRFIGLMLLVCTLCCIYSLLSLPKTSPETSQENVNVRPTITTNHTLKRPPPCLPDSPLYYKCHLPKYMYTPEGLFDKTLDQRTKGAKVIFLTVIDMPYVDYALNLYESSYKRHGIRNFLFICTDKESASHLTNLGIGCFYFEQDVKTPVLTDQPSEDLKKKTHIKTKVALSALLLGYTIVMTEPDCVFLKDPTKHLMKSVKKYDIQLMYDVSDITTAFYIAIPSSASVKAHKKVLAIGLKNETDITDRRAMISVLHQEGWGQRSPHSNLRTTFLDRKKFQDGFTYFEAGFRMFYGDNPCQSCIVVHCNWMDNKAAKIYRMRENVLWFVDDYGYYSSSYRKYLTYSNPRLEKGPLETVRLEMRTLKEALFIAILLNRTLILPTFHCGHCSENACKNIKRECSLNAYIDITGFEFAVGNQYREHSFLSNPLVPDSTRRFTSRKILVRSSKLEIPLEVESSEVKHIFVPSNLEKGATVSEIKSWFSEKSFARLSVLQFHSLHGVLEDVQSNPKFRTLLRRFKLGATEVNYRQNKLDRRFHTPGDIF